MTATDDLAGRLAEMERQLAELTAEVASNEEKMRRSQERELRLLRADDLESLLQELTSGLRESYGLEYVSIVLCDPDFDIRHLLLAAGVHADEFESLVMVESLTGLAPQYVALRQPWLGTYAACDHQLVFPGAAELASVAMIPLMHRQQLFGSINLGSRDRARFTEAHAADFLAHLGVIASFCIENVINRARLLRSGFTDVLTGWHNRRYLQVRIKEELARARRDQTHLACLMLDIDHFKAVNDTWGHAAGDAVLQEMAGRIDAQVRASDVAARYGGEEFIILLPATSESAALQTAERIRRAVSADSYELPHGEFIEVTASIGVAGILPQRDGNDLKTIGESLIARADVALYRAKEQGRNRVCAEGDR
jgi:diguanylate cyclase (GGDEF)-like protein